MEHGRLTRWTGRPRPQHASARVASQILRTTPLGVSPASPLASPLPRDSKTLSPSPSVALAGSAICPAFRPFLTGSAPQTEFGVTHSKQRTEKFLTGARMHIKGSAISTPKTQKLARVKLRNRHDAYGSCAFLPGSVQQVECDVSYSKQSTGEFLPGATTASKAHTKSSNVDTKLSEGRAWLRL
jgi:hypothetical protein